MKRQWQPEELIEHFIVLPDEQALLPTKTNATAHNQLGFAVLLKFFQYAARFPFHKNEVPKTVITFIGNQLGIPYEQYLRYNWSGRTIKSHRTQIRAFLGFRTATQPTSQNQKAGQGADLRLPADGSTGATESDSCENRNGTSLADD